MKTLEKIILIKKVNQQAKTIIITCFAYNTGYQYQIKIKKYHNIKTSLTASNYLNKFKKLGFYQEEEKTEETEEILSDNNKSDFSIL